MTDIQGQLDDLRLDLGDYTLGPLEGTNNADRPNGQAAVVKSLYQLHVRADELFGIDGKPGLIAEMQSDIANLRAQIGMLQKQIAAIAPVITPVNYPVGAYGLPMRPLTNGEQRNVIDALVRGGYELAPDVELNFTKGVYPNQNALVIDRVKEIYYRDNTPVADKAALKVFLSAIDQRDMQTNAILAPDDPRVVPISGTLAVGAATSAPVNQGSTPVVYAESFVMVNPETGFTIWIGMSKNDDGLSVLYNYKFPWQGGASSNPKLPQMLVRMERNGGMSINANAPQQDADGNPIPLGPWDGLKGKDIEFFPLGFDRGDSQGKSQHVDIACLQAGRSLRLGASSETAKPVFHLEVTADGANVDGRPL